jgi:hypothetical protein
MYTRRSIVLALMLTGCFERSLEPVDPCTTSHQGASISIGGIDEVDLLFLVDNSSSMAEHQAQLRDQIPRLVSTLVTGHRDAAHGGDFPPPRSIHVGVVSSTMGLGPITGVPSCPSGFGDDGILFGRSPSPAAGCTSPAPPRGIFEFVQGDSSAQFASDVACTAVLGTGGCGLEFELEPILKALAPGPDATGGSSVQWTAPGYQPPMFYMGTFGHGNDPATNGGFLRPNSALVILTLNDEDDGSTDHYEIFGNDPTYTGWPLNVRPVEFADQLFPVQRYVDGLVGLRTNPSLVIYSTITGIPNDLSPGPGVPTTRDRLDAILADPRMIPMPDPNHNERLVPVCSDTMGTQTAVPGLRMVQVARGLLDRGATVAVHSICENDLTPAIDDVIERLVGVFRSECLGRALNTDAEGRVACDVLELLPASGDETHCASLEHPEAYTFVRTQTTTFADGTTSTRELCRVRQLDRASAAAGGVGWAYDDGNPALGAFSMLPTGCSQRVGFSTIQVINGAELQFDCTETILPGSDSPAELGSFCDPTTGEVNFSSVACSSGTAIHGNPTRLACDAFGRSCGIACTTDADCTSAGLLSYVCDPRTATQWFGDGQVPSGISPIATHQFCVNPTCGQLIP